MIGVTFNAVRYNGDGNFICDLGIISDKDCEVLEEEKPANDPNKLAWKGTLGPWYAVEYAGQWNLNDGPYYECKNVMSADDVTYEIAEANSFMASAAPEAIEFIADLLENLEVFHALDHPYWVARAEEILKKAYNF